MGAGAVTYGERPAAENIPAGTHIPLGACDATASGSEDAQVRLARRGAASVLSLCAHHYSELEFALAVAGWQVTWDNRG
jgi:hypothetical protein